MRTLNSGDSSPDNVIKQEIAEFSWDCLCSPNTDDDDDVA